MSSTLPKASVVLLGAMLATCILAIGQEVYKTTWTRAMDAPAAAEQAKLGILYYFPARGVDEEHSVFTLEEISFQSRQSPMVKAAGKDEEHLRDEYPVSDKVHTIIVTDWYGNPIEKFTATSTKRKIPAAKIVEAIKSARGSIESLRLQIAKRMESAGKSFERKSWRSAIKEYAVVAALRGFPESAKAQEALDEIADIGRREIEMAQREAATDRDEAVKKLRRIERDFKGSPVEMEAREAIEKLKGC